MNDPRLWFIIKLVVLTAAYYVLMMVVLPLLNLSPMAVLISLVMAGLTWGLWSLRKIAQGGGGGEG